MSPHRHSSKVRVLVHVVSVAVAAAICGPAAAQTELRVAGDVIIAGGGSNTSTVRYSTGVVGDRAGVAGPVTIQLSAAYPTLVIRGPQHFTEACSTAADCWDSDRCMESTGSAQGACGWSGLEVASQCGDASAVDENLDACAGVLALSRRSGTGFDPQLAQTDQCLAAGAKIATLSSTCPVERYRQSWEDKGLDALAAAERQLASSGGQLDRTDVRRYLQRIGTWYAGERALYPPGSGAADERVWAQTSRALGAFWSVVYEKAGVPTPGSSNPPDALLDTLFQRGLEADRTVLMAALTSPAPIRSAPLAQLMGDAFQSMSTRMGQVGLYHDLACRFRNNPAALQYPCAHGQVRSELSQLTRLLAATADPSELSGVLASAPPSSSTVNWNRWKDVFTALSSQQTGASPAFQAAVLDATPGVTSYSPELIAPRAPDPSAGPPPAIQVTPPLSRLAEIVQQARVRANSYELTGLFDSRYQGSLRAGVQQDRVIEVINRVRSRTGDLQGQLDRYSSTRLSLANSILQGMTNLATQQSVHDKLQQSFQRESQLRADLAGLRNTIEVQEARFGEFMHAYDSVAQLVASNPSTRVNHLTATAMVTPADARWPVDRALPVPWDPLSRFVAPAAGTSWPIHGAKGDVISFNTTGSWSSTCALRTAHFVNPLTGKDATYVVPQPTLTGPEGYLVALNSNTFTVTSNQSVHTVDRYVNDSTVDKSCSGTGISIGVSYVVSMGDLIHASDDYCTEHDEGTRTSDLTSNGVSSGDESRFSASFTTGIRLPNTPFPAFPAGSLLLVQVAAGGTERSQIRDVQILQKPYSSVVLGDDVDLYLVVNDIADPACGPADTNALTVTINQMRPFGTLAVQLGQGMASALARLHAKQDLLLEQGRVGPEQMAELRDQAFMDLVTACGTGCSSVSYYPAEILRFFDTWVSKELATIERKVDARTTEREIALIELEHEDLYHQLHNLGEQAPILTLIPDRLLKDLDTEMLQSNTEHLLELLIADLYPIVDLQQPATLRNLDANALNALLGPQLDWTGGLSDWTRAAVVASTNIVDRLSDSLGNSPPLNDRILALGIPNPRNPPRYGSWQRVSPERARQVWDAIDGRARFVSLALEPSDLYSMMAGATDVLLCNESEPVITAMALYLVREGGYETFPGLLTPVSIDRNLHFPDVGVLKNYRIDNDDWLSLGVAVLTGEAADLDANVVALTSDNAPLRYRAGSGLSPFAQFDISLSNLTTSPQGVAPVDKANELVLVFRAKTRNVGSVRLSPMCQ